MKKELSYNRDYLVVTSNSFIEGHQNMTLQEARLLWLTISQVTRSDHKLMKYTTTCSQLAEFYGCSRQLISRDIKSVCKNLMKRVIEISDGKNWRMYHIVESCEYIEGELTIRLSDDLEPYLLQLRKYYTQNILDTMLKFKSYYSARLYQLITCRSQGKYEYDFYMSIADIREYFQTGKKYELTRTLLDKTVMFAVNEINRVDTSMHVECEIKKIRGKIDGVHITMTSI